MNIVITGHIDHGKSTLIGRILFDTHSIPDSVIEEVKAASDGGEIKFAYFLDCLQEERAKDITIDTTQTFFKSAKRNYIIIDAPGHKEFIKNMVSGASLASTAVIIIDVERGLEEQTKRHAYVLKLLGISSIIVAVNKLDSVNYDQSRFQAIETGVAELFGKLKIKPVAVLPIAAKNGDNVVTRSKNMPWYTGPSIVELLDLLPEEEDLSKGEMRFPIQDIYPDGNTQIVVGRVESGTVKPGMKVKLAPSGQESTVESVQVFEGKRDAATTGECVGITLKPAVPVSRGLVAFAGTPPQTSKSLKTIIFTMAETPLTKDQKLSCQCGTLAVDCRVTDIEEKIDSSTLETIKDRPEALEATQVGRVTLEFSNSLVYDEFHKVPGLGRFILSHQGDICAAGIIREAALGAQR